MTYSQDMCISRDEANYNASLIPRVRKSSLSGQSDQLQGLGNNYIIGEHPAKTFFNLLSDSLVWTQWI